MYQSGRRVTPKYSFNPDDDLCLLIFHFGLQTAFFQHSKYTRSETVQQCSIMPSPQKKNRKRNGKSGAPPRDLSRDTILRMVEQVIIASLVRLHIKISNVRTPTRRKATHQRRSQQLNAKCFTVLPDTVSTYLYICCPSPTQ